MIHLVVSRPAEARPLVEFLGLAATDDGAFPLYRGEHRGHDHVLVVAGPGKLATAAATGYLLLAGGGVRDDGWLHVGVGAHAEMEIGSGVLAHKVVDAGSGTAWYPPTLLGDGAIGTTPGVASAGTGHAALTTATVVTVEGLEGEYDGSAVFDLESSGFFTAAGRTTGVELVHAYKVVADNHAATLGDNFGPAVVEDLVRSKLGVLDTLIDQLRELCADARAQRSGEGAPGAVPREERLR